MKMGFTMGVYDLPHQGHINFFKKAKQLCDILIVGVVADEAVKKQKGEGRPIMTQKNREDVVRAFSNVDHVVSLESFDPTDEITHRIGEMSMFFKGEDQDHINHNCATDYGVPLVILTRTPDISTSKTIERLNNAN